jgi:hypothetical protein
MTEIEILVRNLLAASRYAMPLAEARRLIDERRRRLLAEPEPPPEPDFSAPEPVHIADDPQAFARGFLARNPGAVPRKPFDVIPGGKDGGGPKQA